ncbi:hypothetical protein [Petroclostridium xylanilyticum]|uniref:hypothetical protein n=1 Tax=Petroclostridium xylanilyticum TaxID=1792311 RepID=UPI0018E32030|nr:hypothetical protein [Petroclostridium xylanilyticum]
MTPLFRDDMLRNGGVLAWQDMHEKKSSSGIYHIMLKVINQQDIFEDDRDRRIGHTKIR